MKTILKVFIIKILADQNNYYKKHNMKNKEEIKSFCKNHNITEDQFLGKEKIAGNLDLRSLTSIPKGFNPTVGGNLYLRSLTSIPKGFNPTVGGDLYLSSLTSIPKGFNPTVGGYLYLSSLTSIPKGFNPTVGGYLYLSSLTSIPKGFNPTVGGDLYLSSLTSIPKGFNPTVGGYLDLSSLTSIPKGFNPTVGGDLYLSSLTSIPKGFNPTVGGDLYLSSGLKAEFKKMQNVPLFRNYLSWRKGKYIKVDGILCEVLVARGNVYKIKIAGKLVESFLVTNGTDWAHGATLKKANEDLHFKVISEKLKKDPIKKDTIITMQYYRIVTGACEQGCKSWMQQNGIPDEPIKAIDLLPILEKTNAYGKKQFKKLITF
jgi:hypothetical protein